MFPLLQKRFAQFAACCSKVPMDLLRSIQNGCGNILGIIFLGGGNYFFSMVSIGGGDVSGGGGLSLQRR